MQLALSAGATPENRIVPDILTKTEYARHYGCKPPYISKLIREGKLYGAAITPSGKINKSVADAQIDDLRDPARSSKRDDSPDPDENQDDDCEENEDEEGEAPLKADESRRYATERALTESIKRKKLEIELAKMVGDVVLREDVEREAENTARAFRNKFLELPADIAGKLLYQENEQAVIMILREAIVRCLTELSENMASSEAPGSIENSEENKINDAE